MIIIAKRINKTVELEAEKRIEIGIILTNQISRSMTNRTGFKFNQWNASIFMRVEKGRNMGQLIILDLDVEQHGSYKADRS